MSDVKKTIIAQAGQPDERNVVYTEEALKKMKADLEKKGGVPVVDRPGGTKVVGHAGSFVLSEDGKVLYANLEMSREDVDKLLQGEQDDGSREARR